jgi:hypothetical protein
MISFFSDEAQQEVAGPRLLHLSIYQLEKGKRGSVGQSQFCLQHFLPELPCAF